MTKQKTTKPTSGTPKPPKPKVVKHPIHSRDTAFLELFLAHWLESAERAHTKARAFRDRAPDLPSADANVAHWSSVCAGIRWMMSHKSSDLNFDPPPFPNRTTYGTSDVGG